MAFHDRALVDVPAKLAPVFEGEAGVNEGLNVRGAHGGRGSGKTRSFAKMSAVWGYKWAEAGIKGQIVLGRELQTDIDGSSLEEVKEAIRSEPWLEAYYDIGENYVKTKNGLIEYTQAGLRFGFKSVKSKARVMLLWVDEAEGVSEIAWRTVIPTLREEGAELWVTWNPEEERSATNMRFRVKPPSGSKIIQLNWRDNPWFTKVLAQQRRDDKKNFPDTYDHVWEGDYLNMMEGAFFGREMRAAKTEGRICAIPVESHALTFTFWDLGIADDTAIWVMQVVGKELRLIGYYGDCGYSLGHYLDWVEDFGETHNIRRWAKNFGPHDIEVRELQTGKSRKEWAKKERGFEFTKVERVENKQDSIDALRRIMPRLWFDKTRCAEGIECIRGYRREFDNDRQVFRKNPLHNWASNGADALQQMGLVWDDKLIDTKTPLQKAQEAAAARGRGTEGDWMG